jgi:hypothetical protein
MSCFNILSKEEKKNKLATQRKDSVNKANKLNIKNLLSKNIALAEWDTLNLFTYELEDLFLYRTNSIAFDGILIDIIVKDSTFCLIAIKKNSRYLEKYIAEIIVPDELFFKLKNQEKLFKDRTSGYFIIKPHKIINGSPIINPYKERDNENTYLYIEDYIEIFEPTKIQGTLIDYYINIK